MIKKEIKVWEAEILVLGITFKENCPDVRNTRVVDIIRELKSYDINVTIFDPWADPAVVKHEYGFEVVNDLKDDKGTYDAAILAVAHEDFLDCAWKNKLKPSSVIYDVKGCLDKNMVDARL